MLEATTTPAEQIMMLRSSLPMEAPVLMPTNFPDLIWIWATAVTLILLGVIAYLLREMRAEQRQTNKIIVDILIKQTATETQLKDHIENTGIHCKGINCPELSRKASTT